jgi:hypothetical protein
MIRSWNRRLPHPHVMAGLVPLLSGWYERVKSEAEFCSLQSTDVMAGLVPAIHAGPPPRTSNVVRKGAAWMAGTSPAMTRGGRESPAHRTPSSCSASRARRFAGAARPLTPPRADSVCSPCCFGERSGQRPASRAKTTWTAIATPTGRSHPEGTETKCTTGAAG